MNAYQRVSLINEIAVKLQQEMTTVSINTLLGAYELKGKYEGSVGSKRVYVQELLKLESGEKILKIAKDLEMETSSYTSIVHDSTESRVWLSGKTKVFISHLAKDKEKASKIQYYLLKNEMSGFVAHEDIEPNDDWQKSIESALKTMDVLVALLTPGFFSSIWTNQEIGFALGLNKPILTIKNGEDPKGFVGKYQAVNGNGRLPKDIVNDLIRYINRALKE